MTRSSLESARPLPGATGLGRTSRHEAFGSLRSAIASAVFALIGAGCGGSAAAAVAPDGRPIALRLARVDVSRGDPAEGFKEATRAHAQTEAFGCAEHADDAGPGHIELWVDVDAEGVTVAGILHGTAGDDALTECIARAMTGARLDPTGAAYRLRLRFEASR